MTAARQTSLVQSVGIGLNETCFVLAGGVAFGAGFGMTKAHQPDEFIRIDDMMKHGQICIQAMYELIT
ncbi:hypothetical protein [Paenibacillus spongiae]|uniref:M20/M25/M40 family metallo-hydrolase n=1 Tax=Paenibacillus spongiae TaxID=2909671 RepID=A0ABY5SIK5_9BACL|nr:hypothetical protein [Paenibacillus spongiae]UVI33260.1 hypothetical protein L1F29_16060 [Paenibacillus spongiae]